MPLTAILLSAATQTPRRASPPVDDVVVTAPSPHRWRAALVVGAGDRLQCRVIRPSGDAATDRQGCAAMEQCFATERPQIMAAAAPGSTQAARRRLLAAAHRELDACFRRVSLAFATLDIVAPDISDPAHRR